MVAQISCFLVFPAGALPNISIRNRVRIAFGALHWRIQGRGARDARPPISVKFLSFSCNFQQKNLSNNRFLRQSQGLASPVWEILDLPLPWAVISFTAIAIHIISTGETPFLYLSYFFWRLHVTVSLTGNKYCKSCLVWEDSPLGELFKQSVQPMRGSTLLCDCKHPRHVFV